MCRTVEVEEEAWAGGPAPPAAAAFNSLSAKTRRKLPDLPPPPPSHLLILLVCDCELQRSVQSYLPSLLLALLHVHGEKAVTALHTTG